MFGGFMNAVASLLNSSYNSYAAGEPNPYPGQIGPEAWQSYANKLQLPGTAGLSVPNYAPNAPPGGIIFFTALFSAQSPGFGVGSQANQETIFMHEQIHQANHDPLIDFGIDIYYDANHALINGNCNPHPIEQQSAPISGQLIQP
jgi:hypothetical protein